MCVVTDPGGGKGEGEINEREVTRLYTVLSKPAFPLEAFPTAWSGLTAFTLRVDEQTLPHCLLRSVACIGIIIQSVFLVVRSTGGQRERERERERERAVR